MSAKAVVLILGAGPRIGAAVADKFSKDGYRVAIASRSASNGVIDQKGFLSLQADFAQPDEIASIFAAVEDRFHSPPSVVVYNAGSITKPPQEDDPLSIAAKDVQKDFIINTVTPYIVAHEAVKAWKRSPNDLKKSFIYTGNITNVKIVSMPLMVNVGMGKSAASYWIGTADAAHAKSGYRFYYADERHADGRLKGFELDGDAHGEFYAHLATHSGDVPWHATFVKGLGYTKF